jgi:hypothetical protein
VFSPAMSFNEALSQHSLNVNALNSPIIVIGLKKIMDVDNTHHSPTFTNLALPPHDEIWRFQNMEKRAPNLVQ